jgi:hypothetical protein
VPRLAERGQRAEGMAMSFAVGYSLDESKLLLALSNFAYIDETPLPNESV